MRTVGGGGEQRGFSRARNRLRFELTAAAYNFTCLTDIEAVAHA